MARRGRKGPRTAGPGTRGVRTCVGCRARCEREALVRLVCDPEGQLFVDRYLRAPGRGAHLCYSRRGVEEAVRRKALGRAFKQRVEVEVETLVSQIQEAIVARIWDALRIGRPGGWTVSGGDTLEREAGKLKLLVIAEDAAEGSRQKLEQRARAVGTQVETFGTVAALGACQGKERRAAVGVTDPNLAGRLSLEFERLRRMAEPEAAQPGCGLS